MIDTVIIALQNGYAYVRKHPQLLVTVLLVAVIPLAFIISGQQFLNAARLNQETLERERIGMFHDATTRLFVALAFDATELATHIQALSEQNPDIVQFIVAKREGSTVRIVTSLTEVSADVVPDTVYHAAHIRPGTSVITPLVRDGVRYWQSVRLSESDAGAYYLFTETSLARIDALFAARIRSAYYWLFGILGVVLLLILRHVRLIDYAYLYRETKRANEMKDLFTNMIAHELRAPLTAMRGYASLIREKGDVADDVRTAAQRIEQGAGRLVLIVSDLLDVARIHSGKLAIRSESVPVAEVITNVVETMRLIAAEKHILVETDTLPSGVFIQGDEKRLYQALTNLVSNAIKYTKAGSIRVSLDERSDRVEIRVKDTGMGMSAEHQKQLFAPFFRIENTETEGTVGTGLGMWITKQLVELMRGSIAVESIKGVGTHMVITLPKS
jgi:signal transduction histidine kinase